MREKITIWGPSNIYNSAKLGSNVQVGAFTEIGENVQVGNGVRIGFNCFIPENIKIENKVWIGPRVTFTNDMYPPSGKDKWKTTLVKNCARIGAGVTVLPGIIIGEGALIGAGSVVTKNVPAGEVWAGNPAKKINGEK